MSLSHSGEHILECLSSLPIPTVSKGAVDPAGPWAGNVYRCADASCGCVTAATCGQEISLPNLPSFGHLVCLLLFSPLPVAGSRESTQVRTSHFRSSNSRRQTVKCRFCSKLGSVLLEPDRQWNSILQTKLFIPSLLLTVSSLRQCLPTLCSAYLSGGHTGGDLHHTHSAQTVSISPTGFFSFGFFLVWFHVCFFNEVASLKILSSCLLISPAWMT